MPKTQETKFVNSLFLTNLIQSQYAETEVKIKAYDVEPATAEINDPFARSSMNRILVKYVSKENPMENLITFVAKIKPTEGKLVEEFKKSDVFDKEIFIYKNVLPNLVAIISKLGGTVELAPQLIYSSDVPSNLMVLEDLTVRGYSVENQQLGLNLEQSKMAIEKIAFFHAASAILITERPNDLAKFAKGTFHADHKEQLKYFTSALAAIAESASELGINSNVANKLKALPQKAVQKAIEAYGSDFQGFKVLNHGDLWTNNIMYKYNKTELIDAVFVDFQNCVVGSPIIDLVYFLTSSPSYDVLEKSKDELVYIYYETLALLLQRLNYKKTIPSLIDLQVELLKHGALEVILSLTTAPFLRTKNAQNTPAMQPTLYNEGQKVDLKPVLKAHASHINQQLKNYEICGLLDWGAAESKIKGLMGRFQR
ncbi:uncharacterized protein LOC131683527 [Topomyia yanbarensis]|uniref:uncharacterized protein LOC131683527 n=1 Tax=Topomyia yanbarensis TaxID=2498891 RepID=UPI00273B0223|nr:uncharacterized protein LOC131683527 [Topomyia yanbarensis]